MIEHAQRAGKLPRQGYDREQKEITCVRLPLSSHMVKTRVLDPIPALDESQLSQALRDEGIKEVSFTPTVIKLTLDTTT